jgi:transcriptional regulator with XRE-family HTH domain
MSTSNNDHIDQLVQERWRDLGLSPSDLAEVLRAEPAAAENGANGAARVDTRRLAKVAEVLGITADIVHPQPTATVRARARIQAAQSLQSLLELRMLRVLREVQDPETRRILVELAEQIVRRQTTPPEPG